jgi:signal transduction histidine kinase
MTRKPAGARPRRSSASEEDRLAALGTLAAGMSHEILNPVNTISLACQYLEALLAKGELDEGVVREHFQLIHVELGRIRKILDDCSRFRRIPHCRPERVDLGGLLLDEIESYRRGLAADAQRPTTGQIRFDLGGIEAASGLWVAIDTTAFRQLLVHLLDNALQAMPKGGTVTLAARRARASVTLEISDEGAGIPAEVMHKVFEPYFTTRPDALGIGLTLVRAIVRAHGGSVSLRSRVGKGTRVAVRFPLPAQTATTSPQA